MRYGNFLSEARQSNAEVREAIRSSHRFIVGLMSCPIAQMTVDAISTDSFEFVNNSYTTLHEPKNLLDFQSPGCLCISILHDNVHQNPRIQEATCLESAVPLKTPGGHLST